MDSRRNFIKTITAASIASAMNLNECKSSNTVAGATVISTWNNINANKAAWSSLSQTGSSLDAVEAGARIPEADPKDMSVGYGGRLDRNGNLTLDACIMDSKGNAGSVSYLQHIKHPISVARKVMEDTPHVMLSGDGALEFALEKGFKKEDLRTKEAIKAWKEWLVKSEYKPKANIELHDTIGILALNESNELSGACTTSGMAYKMSGRVGDSPIIGAGLYVDGEYGACVATGLGELVMRTLSSFLVVELIRQGLSPQKACEEAIGRIIEKNKSAEHQVGLLAISKEGQIGAFSIQNGFTYAISRNATHEIIKSNSYF